MNPAITKSIQLGFIGIGNMGSRIARRLIDHGFALIVYDSNVERALALAEQALALAEGRPLTPELAWQAHSMLGAALYTPGAPSLYTRSSPNICQSVEFCLRLQYNYVEISLHGVTMMATRAGIRAGDLVRIVDREATPQDQKVGLFYNHYRCLPGQVRPLAGQTRQAEQ